MTDDEVRRAVEAPARYAGLTVEQDLLEAIVADVRGRPGSLPLLSTALLDTWERRKGRTLTHAGYLAAGGVPGALARLADTAYAKLAPAEQAAARRILVRLAEAGEGERRCAAGYRWRRWPLPVTKPHVRTGCGPALVACQR
jgi:hypothetical protein